MNDADHVRNLLGRYADAVAAYQQALNTVDTIEGHLGLSLPLMALRRWKEAETACRKVLKTAAGNYLAHSRLAYVLYNAGRYGDAEKAYATLVAEYPSDVEMRTGLGWAQLKQGQTAKAKASFEFVLRISPDYTSARQGLDACK